MSKRFNVICVSTGYVEEHRVASAIFTRQAPQPWEPYKTADEALDSLARDLFEMYRCGVLERSYKPRLKKCCVKHKGQNYCPNCGTAIDTTKKFDPEEFSEWIVDLLGGTADNWGGYDLANWWPWTPMQSALEEFPADEWVFLEDDWAEQKLAERAVKYVPRELLCEELLEE